MVFVERSIKSEMPKDAIILTPSQALNYQLDNIHSFDSKENWPLIQGKKIMGICAGLQAGYIISKFRQKLKLRKYGLLTLSIPFIAGPTVITSLLHFKNVTTSVILQDECSICVMTKSVFLSTVFGNIIPAIGGGLMSLWYGHNVGTYTLPPLQWKYLPKLLKQVLTMNKSLVPVYYGFLAFNIISSSAMIALQEKTMENIHQKLAEKDFALAKEIYLREQRRRKYNI